MILILSDKFDLHADMMENMLLKKQARYIRFNLDKESLLKTHVSFTNNLWVITVNDITFSSAEVACVWCRRIFVELLLEESQDTSPSFKIWKNEWNKTLVGLYTHLKNAKWLNFYRHALKAENKYIQMEYAKNIGFLTPMTLVSNIRTDIINFSRQFDSVALKLMHQDFYSIEPGKYAGFYVNKLHYEDFYSFGHIGENPIVVQEYIEKNYEVRYTVIGNSHLVCKIDSQYSLKAKDDWRRYDIPNTPHSIISAPDDIHKKVKKIMKKMNISYGALDFIVDKNNYWYFLEINSMGQYLWIEDLTGLPITETICEWLIHNSKY